MLQGPSRCGPQSHVHRFGASPRPWSPPPVPSLPGPCPALRDLGHCPCICRYSHLGHFPAHTKCVTSSLKPHPLGRCVPASGPSQQRSLQALALGRSAHCTHIAASPVKRKLSTTPRRHPSSPGPGARCPCLSSFLPSPHTHGYCVVASPRETVPAIQWALQETCGRSNKWTTQPVGESPG